METLVKEFEYIKQQIKMDNYVKIITKLTNFYIDLELARTGLLIKLEDAMEMAHNTFCAVKNAGVLDELNMIVQDQINE